MRYVALGDSYTIGTSVERRGELAEPARRARPGAAARRQPGRERLHLGDLIADELPALAGLRAGLRHAADRRQRRRPGHARGALRAPTSRRSWTRSWPVCQRGPGRCASPRRTTRSPRRERHSGRRSSSGPGIERVNAVLCARPARRTASGFVPEIFEISQAAARDRSLVAGDGLHPSGAQYALWVDAIQPVVEELLLPSGDR